MTHRLERLVIFALLALIAPACLAAQFTFANGNIQLTVPDGWPRILQSKGDPETMVFQVPDPSPDSRNALARISVTTEQVHDIISFERFVQENSARAHVLPDYQADKLHSTSTTLRYTADDGSVQQTYVEHYSLHHGYAVVVRCVRPSHSQAGAAWAATFDRGCASIAASIK
ncbi:MAG TPA: hypothetical protein VF269_04910 [Rhodanobacteraceae bacterium]